MNYQYDLYTSVFVKSNNIVYRGYDNLGKRISSQIKYEPYLYVQSKSGKSTHHTLDGLPVDRVDFDTMYDAREYVKNFKDVSGMKIYGMDKWIFTFLHDNHPKEIKYRKERIAIGNIDIEVDSEDHFATVENPDQEITTIAFKKHHLGQTTKYAFGMFPWPEAPDDLIYVQCKDELAMLRKFIDLWQQWDIDIITGWYTDLFDIPYLIRRIIRVLGEEWANKLSPWGIITSSEKTDPKSGRINLVYNIAGIESVDYMRLYQKFVLTKEESYSLNHILGVLGLESKVEYEGSLDDLYRSNFSEFMKYNVRDVDAVDDIDKKTNLMDQALTLAYDARIPIQEVFGTVTMWDQIVHCHLAEKNIVVPPMVFRSKSEQFAGAYIKEPKIDKYKWIVSLDYEALYPSLAIWGNFSPETYRGRLDDYYSVEDLLNKQMPQSVTDFLVENNLSLAANMTLWSRDKIGLFPELFSSFKFKRKAFKKDMLNAKSKKEASKNLDRTELRELEDLITRCNNMQGAMKIKNNSGYGAIGNAFFRYYQLDFAEAITLSGQFADQWIERRLNEYLNKIFQTDGYEYAIYADTDSVYVTLDPIVEKVFGKDQKDISKIIEFMDKVTEDKIQPFVNKSIAEMSRMMNAYDPSALVMKREALADTGIWIGKKCYVLSIYDNEGVKYAEPEIKMLGIAAVKSSTPKVCRTAIKTAINIMLSGKESDLISYTEEFRKTFNQLPFEQFAAPIGCNGLVKYGDKNTLYISKTPAQVKGALIFNSLIKKKGLEKSIPPIKDGDKVKFASLKRPNFLHEDVISCTGKLPPEFGLDEYLDRDASFEKSFVTPVKSLANAIGWSMEVRGTLDDFFSD